MNHSLSELIKTRTLTAHQELEKVLVTRMRAMRDAEDYLGLLQSFYSYFGSIEDRANLYIGSAELPDHLQRRKSASLATDIYALGGKLPQKALPADVPVIENKLQAFGALYVMEGSTLGGPIISRMVKKQLSIDTEEGLSFFNSYGDNLHAMWNTFKLTLDRQAPDEASADIVIAAAQATFRQFKAFLDQSAALI